MSNDHCISNKLKCKLCLNSILTDQKLIVMPCCDEKYHEKCGENFLINEPFCPQCKTNLNQINNIINGWQNELTYSRFKLNLNIQTNKILRQSQKSQFDQLSSNKNNDEIPTSDVLEVYLNEEEESQQDKRLRDTINSLSANKVGYCEICKLTKQLREYIRQEESQMNNKASQPFAQQDHQLSTSLNNQLNSGESNNKNLYNQIQQQSKFNQLVKADQIVTTNQCQNPQENIQNNSQSDIKKVITIDQVNWKDFNPEKQNKTKVFDDQFYKSLEKQDLSKGQEILAKLTNGRNMCEFLGGLLGKNSAFDQPETKSFSDLLEKVDNITKQQMPDLEFNDYSNPENQQKFLQQLGKDLSENFFYHKHKK
ncbi:UNKNOWN [Stylonychia lemnae]|uniref:RING-type domain-containing protein n=1 Tax=Stylonychia lemnae TaxID=5949 RepID=A0A078B9T3_STYLE|nr:UNKNOWN [Stylonychia lemnae]|eukprot:CDW90022.1 UNKNOWN [Stylonychia lemnae]